ncbi:MAG: succinate dehydrogenase iron-sulfur subunit [Dehalococcoidia bacterium]|nr:succinate dehydrogenase iron-sulfur subunit [Dehalococcoidia bacterium]MDW8119243.1 succinate dehydrogenase iron-sulfur subunit [Chloroflexota bacterium]
MRITIKVRRFNPEAPKPQPYWQDYTLEVTKTSTVLDALIRIREEVDESLALRCSCRSAICGSCAMRINGHASLACKTKVSAVVDAHNTLTVEPMGNLPVIKDLVVDMTPHWHKVRAVEPWLQPVGPEPQGEYLAPNEAMLHLAGVMNCIMCGACVSDCTVLEVDSNFLGPAALAKAYRFVADPRDGMTKERLAKYNAYGGIWDCTRCYECVQVCPKGVAPMDRIMAMRERAIGMGLKDTYGARHTLAFEELVEHSGRLDELRLPLKTFGYTNIPKLVGLLPIALRALPKQKAPSPFHKPIPEVKSFQTTFRKARQAAETERQAPTSQAHHG